MMNLELHCLDPNDPAQEFPDASCALEEPNGLLAVGGDLSIRRLLNAYDQGIFPWYNPGEPILWWTPNPRTVFRPGAVHVSRSMKRSINREDYAVTLDRSFESVLASCASPREDQDGTWLGADMRAAYAALHRLGHAHSIEVWRDGRLIGGLYGVARGKVFFGESMFSRATDASKLALVWLSRQLQKWQFQVFDAQVGSAHLYRMGAVDMPRPEFQDILAHAIADKGTASASRWTFDIPVPNSAEHAPKAPTLHRTP